MVATVLVAFCASVANAGIVQGEYDSYDFYLTGSRQTDIGNISTDTLEALQKSFKINVSYNELANGVDFTFIVTDLSMFDKDFAKFTDNGNVKTGVNPGEYFSGELKFANNDKIYDSATSTLKFNEGYDWLMFENAILAGEVSIYGHLQSLKNGISGLKGNSINGAEFTYAGGISGIEEIPVDPEIPTETPEPATMLLFGLGAVALPLTQRFRNK